MASSALLHAEPSSTYARNHNSAVTSPRMGFEMSLVRSLQAWEHYALAFALTRDDGKKLGDEPRESSIVKAWLHQANALYTMLQMHAGQVRVMQEKVIDFLNTTIREHGITDFYLSTL